MLLVLDFKSVASEIYVHPWGASSSESRALLTDAEPASDCRKDPLVFGREPANLKPRSRAGLTGPRGPHKPERGFPSVRFQAARRPNAAPARTGPPPLRMRLVTQQPRAEPVTLTMSSISFCLPSWQPRPPLKAPWRPDLRVRVRPMQPTSPNDGIFDGKSIYWY